MDSNTMSVPPHSSPSNSVPTSFALLFSWICSSSNGSVFSSNVFALAFSAASDGIASSSVPSQAPRHEICGPVSGDPPTSSSPRHTKSVLRQSRSTVRARFAAFRGIAADVGTARGSDPGGALGV